MVLLRLMKGMEEEENGERLSVCVTRKQSNKICVEPDFLGRRLTEGRVCAGEVQEGFKL